MSKESTCNARDIGDLGLILGSGRSPGGGNDNPLQYSCLGNPMDRRSLVGYSPWESQRVGHAKHKHRQITWTKPIYTNACFLSSLSMIELAKQGNVEIIPLKVAQLCPSQAVAHQAPLSMRFSRQEYWSGLPFPSPGDFHNSEVKPGSPALQADSLLSEPPRKQSL